MVFACGDPLRGDDSVAPVAVSGLPSGAAALAEVRVVGALEAEHLVDLPAGVAAVIVDAVVGPEPGAIVELSLAELGARAARVITTSTHQLPLDRVVALAQLLRDEPVMGRFVGVGIEAVTEGAELSEPVAGALPAFRVAIARAITDLAGSPDSPVG